MDLKQQILHHYRVDEMSLREIARRTGADRKTVTRLFGLIWFLIRFVAPVGIVAVFVTNLLL